MDNPTVKDVLDNIITFCENLKTKGLPTITNQINELAKKNESDPVWTGDAKAIVDELGARATALNA